MNNKPIEIITNFATWIPDGYKHPSKGPGKVVENLPQQTRNVLSHLTSDDMINLRNDHVALAIEMANDNFNWQQRLKKCSC